MATMFAAIYPELVGSIALVGCYACKKWKPDWPHGQRPADFEKMIKLLEENWGDFGDFVAVRMPSVASDQNEIEFHNRLFVQSGSPSTAIKITRLNHDLDIRPILPSVPHPSTVVYGPTVRAGSCACASAWGAAANVEMAIAVAIAAVVKFSFISGFLRYFDIGFTSCARTYQRLRFGLLRDEFRRPPH